MGGGRRRRFVPDADPEEDGGVSGEGSSEGAGVGVIASAKGGGGGGGVGAGGAPRLVIEADDGHKAADVICSRVRQCSATQCRTSESGIVASRMGGRGGCFTEGKEGEMENRVSLVVLE